MSRHAEFGPLGCIITDLANRLEILYDMRSFSDVRHDPLSFLHELDRDCPTIREFHNRTGIEYLWASRLLKRSKTLSVEARAAAERSRRAYRVIDLEAPPPPAGCTFRDRRQQYLGERLQLLALLRAGVRTISADLAAPPDTTTAVLSPEATASVFDRIAELEDWAATPANRHGVRPAWRRALLQATHGPWTTARPLEKPVAILPVPDANFAWLFIAQELHWFEEAGLTVLLCHPSDLDVPGTTSPGTPIECPRSRDEGDPTMDLYHAFVHRPLVSPYRYEQPDWEYITQGKALLPALQTVLPLFQQTAQRLFRDPFAGPLCCEVLWQWSAAFRFPCPWTQAHAHHFFELPWTTTVHAWVAR